MSFEPKAQRYRLKLEEIWGENETLIYARTLHLVPPEDLELFQKVLDQVISGAKVEKIEQELDPTRLTQEQIAATRSKGMFPFWDDPSTIIPLLISLPLASFITFRKDVVELIPEINEDFVSTGGGLDYLVYWKPVHKWEQREYVGAYFVGIVSSYEARSLSAEKVSACCFIYHRDEQLEKEILEEMGVVWDSTAPAYGLFYGPTVYTSPKMKKLGIKANTPKRLDGEPFF